MDSFEVNKLLGALLATVFVVLSLGIISDAIFSSHVPEKPGFEIVATEEPAGGDTGGAAAAVPEPIGPLLAKADPAAGATVFKKCTGCHTGENGGSNKAGPNLWGIVNRPVASHGGYSYSAGMKAFSDGGKKVWDYDHLNGFLTAPKAYVKGTAMGYAGVKKIEERAALMAYLRTLADTPAPLPQ